MSDSLKSQEIINQIGGAFPGGFDFYDLGKVLQDKELSPEDVESIPGNCSGVAFSIYPMDEAQVETLTLRTLLLMIFDEDLDAEVYKEIGNVIASRFAGGLSRLVSAEVMITPPLMLKSAAVLRLTRMKKQTLSRRRYFHSHQGKLIPIDVLILRVEGEAKGNA